MTPVKSIGPAVMWDQIVSKSRLARFDPHRRCQKDISPDYLDRSSGHNPLHLPPLLCEPYRIGALLNHVHSPHRNCLSACPSQQHQPFICRTRRFSRPIPMDDPRPEPQYSTGDRGVQSLLQHVQPLQCYLPAVLSMQGHKLTTSTTLQERSCTTHKDTPAGPALSCLSPVTQGIS